MGPMYIETPCNTPGQNESLSNVKEDVLHTTKTSITGALSSDGI